MIENKISHGPDFLILSKKTEFPQGAFQIPIQRDTLCRAIKDNTVCCLSGASLPHIDLLRKFNSIHLEKIMF